MALALAADRLAIAWRLTLGRAAKRELWRAHFEGTQLIRDQLYNPDDDHLPIDEAIRRIAPAFRQVRFDWVLGDAKVRENYHQMFARGTPEIILQSQRSLFGESVWVSIRDGAEEDWVEFLLFPYSDVWIEYRSATDREKQLVTVNAIAGLIGYRVATEDDEPQTPRTSMA